MHEINPEFLNEDCTINHAAAHAAARKARAEALADIARAIRNLVGSARSPLAPPGEGHGDGARHRDHQRSGAGRVAGGQTDRRGQTDHGPVGLQKAKAAQ